MLDQRIQQRKDALAGVLREQILDAFATVAVREGYSHATIAGIVREAKISKSTFYAHYADKEAVYLALQDATRAAKRDALTAAVAQLPENATVGELVHAVVRSYLDATFSRPAFVAQMRIEGQVSSDAAWRARLETGQGFAQTIVALVEQYRAPADPPLTLDLALCGLAGTSSAVIDLAAHEPNARETAERTLTAFWLRLLGQR